jgi:hypothetical protein
MDYDDYMEHGDPDKWKYNGEKQGSGAPTHNPIYPEGSSKRMEIWTDEFGHEVEVHYVEGPDGTIYDVKTSPRSK